MNGKNPISKSPANVAKDSRPRRSVKRGVRIVHGNKELSEKLGRNDLARAVQDAAFKNCCLRSGRYDGANRNHFFPRIVSKPISAGRRTWVITVNDQSHVHQLVRSLTKTNRAGSWRHTNRKEDHYGYQLRKARSIAASPRSRSRSRVRPRFATRAAAIRGRWMTGRGSTAS